MNPYLPACAALLAASVAVSASAQGAAGKKTNQQPPPIPLDQRTPNSTQYRNVFGEYRPSTDTVVSWRAANDLVGRIGGWRVYAREAQRETSVPAEPLPAVSPNAETKKP